MFQRLPRILFFLLAAYIVWIVYLADTGQPFFLKTLAHSFAFGDKVGHFFLFGSCSLLADLAFQRKWLKLGRFSLPWGPFLVFCFAALEESSQYFISSRSFDLVDLAADLAGIVLFSLALRTWSKPPAEKKNLS